MWSFILHGRLSGEFNQPQRKCDLMICSCEDKACFNTRNCSAYVNFNIQTKSICQDMALHVCWEVVCYLSYTFFVFSGPLKCPWRINHYHYDFSSQLTATTSLWDCSTWYLGWMRSYFYYHGLTHWGRVMHIHVSKQTIIGSYNGLLLGWRQAIMWTNAGILLIGPLGTNFSEILIKIYIFSSKKINFKMLSGKCRPFCLSLNVLIDIIAWISNWIQFSVQSNYTSMPLI